MGRSLESLGIEEKQDLVAKIVAKKSGLLNVEWEELRDMFGLEMSPETLRKAGVGIKTAADANLLRPFGEEGETRMERVKLRDTAAQVNTAYTKQARAELLCEAVKDAVASLQPLPPIELLPAHEDSDKELVVCIGDIHYGADIEVKGLYGEVLNIYNSTVFERRMASLIVQVTEIALKEQVDRIHVFLVGDLIDGMLRQSQLQKLEFGIVDSTIQFSEYMARWIAELSKVCEVHVASCSGNHSEIRPLGSKHREFPNENMERIIMWYLEDRLRDNKRVFINSKCNPYTMADVLGFSFMLLHGDSEKKIADIAAETIRLYGKKIDFFICGHKHRENEFPTGYTPDGTSVVIRVPSVCGADTYANSKGYGGQPGATAILMDWDYGRKCVYPIKL